MLKLNKPFDLLQKRGQQQQKNKQNYSSSVTVTLQSHLSTTINSFGLHSVNDIFDDLNGANIKWAESS